MGDRRTDAQPDRRWRRRQRAWVAAAIGFALVVVSLRLTGGAVDAQDALIASPVAVETMAPVEEPAAEELLDSSATAATMEPTSEPSATATASAAPSDTLTPEPTPTTTPSQEPTANPAPSSIDAIRIEVISADGTVGPGGSVAYHVQVTNDANTGVRVRLIASLDRTGWVVNIVEAEGLTPLAQPISLDPGQVRDVSVIIVAPAEAVAGEQATLRLAALDAAET
jgi:hypothetical protein